MFLFIKGDIDGVKSRCVNYWMICWIFTQQMMFLLIFYRF